MPLNSVFAATRIAPSTNPVLGIAARLLSEDRDLVVGRVAPAAAGLDADSVVSLLVAAAQANVRQLRLLIDLVDVVASAERVVLDTFDHAREFEVCDAGAVGAAASLLELTALGDERQMGEHLAAALGAFAAGELVLGAAALTAALSTSVADWLDIDADEAHAEIMAALGSDGRPDAVPGRCTRTIERSARGSIWCRHLG